MSALVLQVQRDSLTQFSKILLAQVRAEVGINHARVKTVRQEASCPQLLSQALREQHVGCLRLTVGSPLVVCGTALFHSYQLFARRTAKP